MKKIIIILVLSVLMLQNIQKEDIITIPEESIRFRIIANSNSSKDQVNKMNVVSELYPSLLKATSGASNIKEARQNINNIQAEIETIVEKYTNNYQINYGDNYFPKKEFKGTTYESGNYESLVIELGEAKGENWWCVLFPPLCLLEAEENNLEDIEYKFYVSEIINKYMK